MSGDDAQEWSSIQNMLANGFKQMLHMQLIYLICTNTNGKPYTKTCVLLTCFLWQLIFAHRENTQSIPWTSPTPKKKLKCNMCKNTLRQERKVALSLLKNWKWNWWLEDDSVKHPPKFNEVCPWKLMVGRQAFPFGDGQFSGASC